MTQTSSSSVTIAWSRVPGATGYRISWHSGRGEDQGFWRGLEVLESHRGGCRSGWNGGWGLIRGPGGALEGRGYPALELSSFPLPGPEKSQLVSGEATVAELDGLEPDTQYTVRVWARVAGVDGTPTSVLVRTGE